MAGRFWREAASLIIVGRTGTKGASCYASDYNLLFLKRSQKSKFMPSALVFPGGVNEQSDFSPEWLDVFKQCGFSQEDLLAHFRQKAPLARFYANKVDGAVMPEVGMRICAIRETFEECGVLLASHHAATLSTEQREAWRKSVHDDASTFLSLFRAVGGCPAVFGLHEWAGWLTPTGMGARRFDTAFYITFLDTIPQAAIDGKEISELQIAQPHAIVEQWQRGELWLPPPQVYEIGRLLRFTAYEDLRRFAVTREKEGVQSHMPVRIKAEDGMISVLPGDDLYPEDPDWTGEREEQPHLDAPMATLRMGRLNRMEIQGARHCRTLSNVRPACGHVQPLDLLSLATDSKL